MPVWSENKENLILTLEETQNKMEAMLYAVLLLEIRLDNIQ